MEGHTDSQGEDATNLDLSQRRANSVRKRLIERRASRAERLEAVGYGETKPVDTNKTAKGRENNRRVEFIILETKHDRGGEGSAVASVDPFPGLLSVEAHTQRTGEPDDDAEQDSARGALAVCLVGGTALAQYTHVGGAERAPACRPEEYVDSSGQRQQREVHVKAAADKHGNAAGQPARPRGGRRLRRPDGGGAPASTWTEAFDFSLPKKALAEKGFSVYRWVNAPPSPEELETKLKKACQLWIISGGPAAAERRSTWRSSSASSTAARASTSGATTSRTTRTPTRWRKALLGTKMRGNLMGDQVVGLQKEPGKTGLLPRHLLTTGLEYIYEGITIATIQPNQTLTPLIYGSAGNLVAAFYDASGKRAILDGGFTRLYVKWDTAGTGRYVKNAAAWLVNVERFGERGGRRAVPQGRRQAPPVSFAAWAWAPRVPRPRPDKSAGKCRVEWPRE